MGSFSWLFADTNNTKNLRANRRGYVACPDGTFICEPCYETYGIFDGKDVYDLVVDWNREFIAENHDHLLPHVHCWTKDGALVRTTYRLKDFPWYPVVADLSIPFEDLHDALIAHLKKELGDKFAPYRTEIRNIGIDIACYDEDNASLPYPIKITSKKTGICYEELPPSKWDPEQGLCEYRSQRYQ
jgi:hypothetical protein